MKWFLVLVVVSVLTVGANISGTVGGSSVNPTAVSESGGGGCTLPAALPCTLE